MATLFLVCDTSGSMYEGGKRFILRNLIRTIDQYYRLRKSPIEIKLVPWSDEAMVAVWSSGQEVPNELLDCNGEAISESLLEKIGKIENGYFAILTDGYWDSSTRKKLNEWSATLEPDHLRIIKVGTDANPRLKGPSVFDAAELLAALKGWVK